MEKHPTFWSDKKKSLKQQHPTITDEDLSFEDREVEQGSESSPQKAGKSRAEDKESVSKCNRPWYS